MKRPSFQFYPGDWLHDTGLCACSLAARGLWIDMLAFMHQGTPYGHLTLPATKEGGKDILRPILPAILARMVGCSEEEVQHFLKELEGAGVFSRTDESVIFSRRMVQDEKLRESRAAGGIESLNNPHVPRPRGPSKDRPKDQRKDTLPGSPSSSSSSSSSRHKNTASENFNATEIAQILCQRNGWSGQGMIWALQEAIDFKATEMPEATLEQVGEWLVRAYFNKREAKGDFAAGPRNFFEQALYRTSSGPPGTFGAPVLGNDLLARSLAQLEGD